MSVQKQVHRIIRNRSGKVVDRVVVRPRGHNLLNEREYQYAIKRAKRKKHEIQTRVFDDSKQKYFRAFRIVRENGRRTAYRIQPGGKEVFGLAARQYVEKRARRRGHEVIFTNAKRPARLDIVSRSAWGAVAPKARETVKWSSRTTTRVHHTASRMKSERLVDEIAYMRQIQKAHQAKGWADIAYSYVIMPSGRVFVGRGKNVVGAHTYGHNGDVGICFAGDFRYDKLTPKAKRAFHDLRIKVGVSKGVAIGHYRTSATTCPGPRLRAELGV